MLALISATRVTCYREGSLLGTLLFQYAIYIVEFRHYCLYISLILLMGSSSYGYCWRAQKEEIQSEETRKKDLPLKRQKAPLHVV